LGGACPWSGTGLPATHPVREALGLGSPRMNDIAWRMAVIDPDTQGRSFAQRAFEDRGWIVQSFDGGAEAVGACRQKPFDVVLLDLGITDVDGLDVLRDLREACVDTEVIVVTSHVSLDSAIRALELDAYAYIAKPVEISDLVRSVENAQDKIALQRLNSELIEHLCRNQAELERAIEEATRELARANARLQEMAVRDGLTNLYNRRYFDERLGDEVSRSKRYGSRLTLVLLDIDHFKAHNDAYGHLRGDDALITLAQVLQDTVRRNDVVARFGGEEFAILLIEATEEHVATVCERIRSAVEATSFMGNTPSHSVGLTVSLGYASCPSDTSDMAGLIESADEALYAAKASGRNCIRSYAGGRLIDPLVDAGEAG